MAMPPPSPFDPAVITNQQEYKKSAQEHAQVSKLFSLYSQYQKVNQDLEDNKNLLQEEDDAEMLELIRSDIVELTDKATELENDIKLLLLPKDPNDEKNIFLEIRAGTGGDEAALFVGDLFRLCEC